MSDTVKLLGIKIRSIRRQRGLSQEQLALRANVNTSYMGQIERGEKSPTVDTLGKIIAVLGITFEELFRFNNAGIQESSNTYTAEIQENSNTYADKILHQLDGRNLYDQEIVYKFIKNFFELWDKK